MIQLIQGYLATLNPYSVIADIVLLAVLIFFIRRGLKKGLMLTLCGLAAVFVALVGACLLSNLLAPRLADQVEPRITAITQRLVEQELQERTSLSRAEKDDFLRELLGKLQEGTLFTMVSGAVEQQLGETGATLGAVVGRSIALTVSHALVFLVSFAALLFLWGLFSHAIDLACRMPVLYTMNTLGGGMLGLLQGLVFAFAAVWLLGHFWTGLTAEVVSDSLLLKLFAETDPAVLLQQSWNLVSQGAAAPEA